MSENDVMDFYADGVDEAELNPGFAGGADAVEAQWALVKVESAKAMKSKDKGTAGVELVLRLDEKFALTPKRKLSFIRFWVSPPRPASGNDKGSQGTKGQISNLLVRCGAKRLGVEVTSGNAHAIAESVAKVITGRSFIASITSKPDQNGVDRNEINGVHEANERNLAAIEEAGFAPNGVEVKERKENGKVVERWLAVKKKAAKAGQAASAGSAAASLR